MHLIVVRPELDDNLPFALCVREAVGFAIGLAEFAVDFNALRHGSNGLLKERNGLFGGVASHIDLPQAEVGHAMVGTSGELFLELLFGGIEFALAPEDGTETVVKSGASWFELLGGTIFGKSLRKTATALQFVTGNFMDGGRVGSYGLKVGKAAVGELAEDLAGAEANLGRRGNGESLFDLREGLGDPVLLDKGSGLLEAGFRRDRQQQESGPGEHAPDYIIGSIVTGLLHLVRELRFDGPDCALGAGAVGPG